MEGTVACRFWRSQRRGASRGALEDPSPSQRPTHSDGQLAWPIRKWLPPLPGAQGQLRRVHWAGHVQREVIFKSWVEVRDWKTSVLRGIRSSAAMTSHQAMLMRVPNTSAAEAPVRPRRLPSRGPASRSAGWSPTPASSSSEHGGTGSAPGPPSAVRAGVPCHCCTKINEAHGPKGCERQHSVSGLI